MTAQCEMAYFYEYRGNKYGGFSSFREARASSERLKRRFKRWDHPEPVFYHGTGTWDTGSKHMLEVINIEKMSDEDADRLYFDEWRQESVCGCESKDKMIGINKVCLHSGNEKHLCRYEDCLIWAKKKLEKENSDGEENRN